MSGKLCIIRIDLETHRIAKRSYIMSERLSPENYVRDVVMPHFSDESSQFKVLPKPLDETWVEDEVNGAITPLVEDKILRLASKTVLYAVTQRKLKKLQRPKIAGLPVARFKVDRFIGDLCRTFAEETSDESPLRHVVELKQEVTEVGHTFVDTAVPFTIKGTKVNGKEDFAVTIEVLPCTFTEDDLLDLANGLGRLERIAKKIWRHYKTYHGEVLVNHGF